MWSIFGFDENTSFRAWLSISRKTSMLTAQDLSYSILSATLLSATLLSATLTISCSTVSYSTVSYYHSQQLLFSATGTLSYCTLSYSTLSYSALSYFSYSTLSCSYCQLLYYVGTSYIGSFPTKLPYLMMMTTMMKMTMTMTMMDDGRWGWLRGRPPQRWWGRERGRRQWWTVTFPPLRKNHFKSCENGPKLQSKRNSGWDTPALVANIIHSAGNCARMAGFATFPCNFSVL